MFDKKPPQPPRKKPTHRWIPTATLCQMVGLAPQTFANTYRRLIPDLATRKAGAHGVEFFGPIAMHAIMAEKVRQDSGGGERVAGDEADRHTRTWYAILEMAREDGEEALQQLQRTLGELLAR